MRSVAQSKIVTITGLVTGHPADKGKKFGDLYGVPASSIYTYETYNSIRDNKAIDAVYIALPNSMHSEFTIRGAEAGKHVFCEKPMAISSAECRRMIDACRAHDVKLMIGLPPPLRSDLPTHSLSCSIRRFRPDPIDANRLLWHEGKAAVASRSSALRGRIAHGPRHLPA